MPKVLVKPHPFILYLLGFFLFLEWLRPLPLITEISHLYVFIGYAAFTFFVTYLQAPFYISFFLKLIGLTAALQIMFFSGSFFSFDWIFLLLDDLRQNFGYIIAADWMQMTDLFRTLLFLVLLWLLSYLMHYWLVVARKIFLFFFATVLYVTIVDTFTVYEADAAIVRTVILGFVLLGLLRLLEINERENVAIERKNFSVFWLASLAVMLTLTSIIGFAAPKIEPQWPDPVPFIKSQAIGASGGGFGSGGGIKRIGYDTNDRRLGGPFIYDNTPLFRVAVDERRYWRVETKEIYTGKGWVTATPEEREPVLLTGERVAPELYEGNVQTKTMTAGIRLVQGRTFSPLIYGGEIAAAQMQGNILLQMNPSTEKIVPYRAGEKPVSLNEYRLVLNVPKFSISALNRPAEPAINVARYLQLPDSLPDRVRELTEKITEDETTRYGKVKAVENYFMNAGFTYETQNVPVPGKNEDYVAQFLFETQRGYCDNFSTAMAVMLRTIGIPTRWVKGFTSGQYIGTTEDGENVYEITNANAHSWVEVYFPGEGWVPFEPTQGFTNDFNVVTSYAASDQTAANPASGVPQRNQASNRLKELAEGQKESKEKDASGEYSAATMWVLVFALLLATVLFATWRKWFGRLFMFRFRYRDDDDAFVSAYRRLLWLLSLYGWKKEPGETLREFARKIDRELDTGAMKQLTVGYEQAIYGGAADPSMWKEARNRLSEIVRKISSC